MKKVLLLFCFSIYCSLYSVAQKIIYLIAAPRSLSTIFLRAMHARGDMVIFNEPSHAYYFKEKFPHNFDQKYFRQLFFCAQSVKQALLQESMQGEKTIFVKDNSYPAYKTLHGDTKFLSNSNITFIFLIRDPLLMLHSYYKSKPNGPFIHGQLKVLYELFEEMKKVRGEEPIVIAVKDLLENPEHIMRQLCKKVGMPFKKEFLIWQPILSIYPSSNVIDITKFKKQIVKKISELSSTAKSQTYIAQDGQVLFDYFQDDWWHEQKQRFGTLYWHKSALLSSGFFNKQYPYEIDVYGVPTFVEVDRKNRQRMKCLYQEQITYYKQLYHYRIR